MKKNKQDLYIFIIMIGLIGLTIGYAALSSTLNINGKSNISKNTWDVYFDNVVVKDDSVEAVKIPTVTDKTTVDFEVALNLPGDFYEFTVDVVNDGTIDAMIESIMKNPTLSETQAKYLNYIVTYENGESITTKQLVGKDSFVRLKVRVEFRKDLVASDLPKETETLNLSFTLNYVQADESSVSVGNNGTAVSLIEFTIAGTSYFAENGMTWQDWVDSRYNTGGFYVESNSGGGSDFISNGSIRVGILDENKISDYYVTPIQVILANEPYTSKTGSN